MKNFNPTYFKAIPQDYLSTFLQKWSYQINESQEKNFLYFLINILKDSKVNLDNILPNGNFKDLRMIEAILKILSVSQYDNYVSEALNALLPYIIDDQKSNKVNSRKMTLSCYLEPFAEKYPKFYNKINPIKTINDFEEFKRKLPTIEECNQLEYQEVKANNNYVIFHFRRDAQYMTPPIERKKSNKRINHTSFKISK